MLAATVAFSIFFGGLFVQANADCPDIEKPAWGEVFCSSGYAEGSVCTLSCEKYYDLAGTTDREIQTTCGSDGEWSVPPIFKCDPIRCYPEHKAPENGDLICSADNLMASLCVFYCDEQYDMVDVEDITAYSTCVDDGDGDAVGRWTNDQGVTFPPQCKLVACDPVIKDPVNGRVVCSASNFAGSFCVYYCNSGYDMVGTSQLVRHTMCQGHFGDAKWTNTRIPKCRKHSTESCQDPPDIRGASYDCDTETLAQGTTCKLICESTTEEPVGPPLNCKANQKWGTKSGFMPKCRKCRPVKKIQMLALIHSSKNEMASKLIFRYSTILQNRRNKVAVQVQRFGGEVGTDQFNSTVVLTKEDRKEIEDLPLPKTDGADIGKALQYADTKFKEMEDGSLQVLIIITEEVKYDESAEMYAKELRENGVEIFAFGFHGAGVRKFTEQDLVKCTGDPNKVFLISTNRQVERSRGRFLRQVSQSAVEKGCTK